MKGIDIHTRIRIAEGLRLDKKYRQATDLFEEIENSQEFGSNVLSDAQRSWVQAHRGAATLGYFSPHTDREGHLDGAEEALRKALEIPTTGNNDPLDDKSFVAKVKYPWAWARLGEIFRLKGNLPPFDFPLVPNDKEYQRQFVARPSEKHYEKSLLCFSIASRQRSGTYPWANAHFGATIINSRRFHAGPHANPIDWIPFPTPAPILIPVPNRAKIAQLALLNALQAHGHRYAWALFHEGSSQFLAIMDRLTALMDAPADSSRSGAKDAPKPDESAAPMEADALFMAYSMVIALVDDNSPLYQHPMHPGAVGKDEYLTLTYDLLDYFPKLRRKPRPLEVSRAFWTSVAKTLTAGLYFLREDDFLPGSERFRFAYTVEYVKFYWAQEIPVLESQAHTLAVDAQKLRKFIDRLFEDISSNEDVWGLFEEPDRCLGKALQILHDSPLPAARRPKTIPSNSRAAHDMDHTGCGVLLRLFDMMMILLKFGVLQKIRGKDTGNVETVLDLYDKTLHVLKHDANQTIEIVHKLVKKTDGGIDNGWLLAPQWALDAEKRLVVAEFLKTQRTE